MALFRSDIFNRETIETILRKIENTTRIQIETLTIFDDDQKDKNTILEQFSTLVTAKVKWFPMAFTYTKEYSWTVKTFKSDKNLADLGRFRGIIETEFYFYEKFLRSLVLLKLSVPKCPTFLYGNLEQTGKEVLVLEDLRDSGFSKVDHTLEGLNTNHLLLAVEWLAKLHGTSYNLMKSYKSGPLGWFKDNPWVRSQKQDILGPLESTIVWSDDDSQHESTLILLQSLSEALESKVPMDLIAAFFEENVCRNNQWRNKFLTLCHGEPWIGNLLFSYSDRKKESAVEIAMCNFHSCSYGSPGVDLAFLLATSTSFEVRTENMTTLLSAYYKTLQSIVGNSLVTEYSMEHLRSDYESGLVQALNFCVFPMRILLNSTCTKGSEIDCESIWKKRIQDCYKEIVNNQNKNIK